MNKRLISLILSLALLISSFTYLIGCNGNGEQESTTPIDNEPSESVQAEDPTEAPTDTPTEAPSQAPTEAPTEIPTEAPTETPTETTGEAPTEQTSEEQTEEPTEALFLNDIVYSDGGAIDKAGIKWDDASFALTEYSIDESKAIVKSSAEVIALLTSNGMAEGEVYIVNEPIVLTANLTCNGNFAAIIASKGIAIKHVNNVTVNNLVVIGSVAVAGAENVSFSKLNITSQGTGIDIDSKSRNIKLEDCRISAADTAVKTDAELISFYRCYLSADKGIISSGNTTTVQNNHIVALSHGILCNGEGSIVRGNLIELSSDGLGIEFENGSSNGLIALNVIKGAQMSVKIRGGFNCAVILNSAIRISCRNSTNLYVVENALGGAVELYENNYLLCDGNTFKNDEKWHGVATLKNTNYNGDGMHDINARTEAGADENLLPHTNKDLFVGMDRQSKVRDLSLQTSYSLDQYISNIAKQDEIVIVPPGAYTVASSSYLSSAHSDTSIYAFGVYMEADKYGQVMRIESADNINVYGLTIGYSKLSSGQAHVLKKLGDKKLLVISSAGFGDKFGSADKEVFSGGGGYLFRGGEFTSWTEIGSWGSYSIVPGSNGAEVNSDGTMVIQLKGTLAAKYYAAIEAGDIISCRIAGDNQQTVSVSSSNDILFKDCVTYGYAAALVFVVGGTSTNVRFERHHNAAHSGNIIDRSTYSKFLTLEERYEVELDVYTDELGRYRGSAARIGSVDATHITGSSEGITAVSCLFENACDDATNHNGSSSRLHDVIDNGDGTTTLVYKANIPETYYNRDKLRGSASGTTMSTRDFAKGDRIFIYTSKGETVCDTTVLAASKQHQSARITLRTEEYTQSSTGKTVKTTWMSYLYEVKVKTSDINLKALDGYDLSDNSYKMDQKVLVDNISRNSVGAKFDNCMVRNNRGRFVIKTRDVSITNCTFKDTSYAGIVLSFESTWGESSVPQNINILNCIFDGTSQTVNEQNNTKFAAISLQGLGDAAAKVTVSEDSIPSKNIRIEGNVFRNVSNNYYITLSACMNVTVKNNVFEARENDTSARVGKAVLVSGCMNVEISDNTYSSFANGDITKVIVANNFKGLTGSDVTNADGTPVFPDNVTQ